MAIQVLNDGELRSVHRSKINTNFSSHESRLNGLDTSFLWAQNEINGAIKANLVRNSDFRFNLRGHASPVTLAAGAFGHSCWKAGASGCTYSWSVVDGITVINITAGTLMQVIDGSNFKLGPYAYSWVGTAEGRLDGGSWWGLNLDGFTVGTAGLSHTIEFGVGTLSDVQMVAGYSNGAYPRTDITLERLLVSRYARVNPTMVGFTTSTTALAGCALNFDYPMRGNANVTLLNGTGAVVDPGVGIRNLTAVPALASPNGDYLDCTIAASTANKPHLILPGRIHFSAEL